MKPFGGRNGTWKPPGSVHFWMISPESRNHVHSISHQLRWRFLGWEEMLKPWRVWPTTLKDRFLVVKGSLRSWETKRMTNKENAKLKEIDFQVGQGGRASLQTSHESDPLSPKSSKKWNLQMEFESLFNFHGFLRKPNRYSSCWDLLIVAEFPLNWYKHQGPRLASFLKDLDLARSNTEEFAHLSGSKSESIGFAAQNENKTELVPFLPSATCTTLQSMQGVQALRGI